MSLSGQWKRYGCCPLDQKGYPAPPQNLAIFTVSGYNYRAIPTWFDHTGQKMMHIQFSVDYIALSYRWSFYKPKGDLCRNVYHLSTSDDIFPVIYEEITGTKMKVERLTRHNGYTSWIVFC